MALLRKLTMGFIVLVGLFLAVTLGATRLLGQKKPSGVAGPEADAFARRIEAAVEREAWDRTQAVEWTFRGKRRHLWDRRRMFDRIAFEDELVLLDLTTRAGVVTKGGVALDGAARDERLARAWAFWANDSFWLNPLTKLFDEGVVRELVALEGEPGMQGLLASYTKGGVTPGDSYLWIVDSNANPVACRMWVTPLPVPGIRVSWDRWQTLETGARVATSHAFPGVTVELTDVRGAATLEKLTGGADPFAPLVRE